MRKLRILNGNMLKIIALAAMTCDHVGAIILPQIDILRIIGRLAFPIFAYMIAEGCFYTRNRKKYFGLVFLLGLLCQIVFYVTERSLYMGILITFSLSILIIYTVDTAAAGTGRAAANGRLKYFWIIAAVLVIVIGIICFILPEVLPQYRFAVDYGFFGVMLPVFIYIPNMFAKQSASLNTALKLVFMAAGLVLVAVFLNWNIQWWSLLAVIVMAMYNGKRGKLNMKYLFYIYYPLHLAAIYLISTLI